MSDVLQASPIYCALGKDQELMVRQVAENFYRPHLEFARYLRPRPSGRLSYDPVDLSGMSPGQIVLAHDAKWTTLGVCLAVHWYPLYLVKEARTLREALRLSKELRKRAPPGFPPANPTAAAYLESDLVFLRELFGHFADLKNWSSALQGIINRFLDSVETELG